MGRDATGPLEIFPTSVNDTTTMMEVMTEINAMTNKRTNSEFEIWMVIRVHKGIFFFNWRRKSMSSWGRWQWDTERTR